MRHRLRAIHLKHWKRCATIYRELIKRGARPDVARSVAANSRRWWRNSYLALNCVLTNAYFDRLGMPRLSSPQPLEPTGADPHAGWCGRGAAHSGCPYADVQRRRNELISICCGEVS